MEYKEHKMGSYTLHTIKSDKFKLCHMEIIFRNNVKREDITKRNVLFDLLMESNAQLPTKRALALKLEDLYNAYLYSVTSKVGNGIITNVCMDFINPKYTDEKALLESLILPFDMLLKPLVTNKEFDSKTLGIVKDRLAADIRSIKETPKKYAILEAFKTLGDNSPSSYSNVGTLEDLELITASNLYEYYQQVLKHDYIDIYIIGNLDMDEVAKIIKTKAEFKVIKNHKFELYTASEKRKPVIVNKPYIYIQTNIVMILNLNKLTSYEKKYVAILYNMILGGGSLETKLYKRLRDENSLCYNVNSLYQKYDGLIIINTSVDVNAKDKAIKLIKQALKDMMGRITEEELNAAKETIISSLNMNMDNIGKIVDNYFYRHISDIDEYEERIKKYKEVTINDIYKLAKKVSISTIYSLIGGEANE